MTILQEPSRELRELLARIDVGIGAYVTERGMWATTTQWEALRYAWSLSNLALRHAEATTTLAATDMALAPAAWVTARAATEAAARCLWLLKAEDQWEREARWLALLYEGSRLGNRNEMQDNELLSAQSSAIKQFADAVAKKLPRGVKVPGMASIQSILLEEGSGIAEFYVLASQYTHGAELATRSSRKDLGIESTYGDFVEARDWVQPVWMSWLAFRITALRLITARGYVTSPDALALADRHTVEARDGFFQSLK